MILVLRYSENRSEHGEGVIPEPPVQGPRFYEFVTIMPINTGYTDVYSIQIKK